MKMPVERDCLEHRFEDSAELADALAQTIASDLRSGIAVRGDATLVVSGGTTPKKFLAKLAQQDLDWAKVTITLADERWVPATHARSNEHLLRGTLLTGRAAAATFISLYTDVADPESGLAEIARRVDALPLPFDAVVLGLGNDGHTASLFPDGDRFAQACDPTNPARVSSMRSATAGEPRITLTLSALAATRALYLQIEGAEKQGTLVRVLAGDGAYARSPLRALLHAARVPLNVYTCA
jgi:6-phosphogluconolactonase